MMKMSKIDNSFKLQKDQALFTVRDIFNMLTNIDELNNHKIRLRENIDGSLQIQIDTSVYTIWEETEIELYKE